MFVGPRQSGTAQTNPIARLVASYVVSVLASVLGINFPLLTVMRCILIRQEWKIFSVLMQDGVLISIMLLGL